MANLATAAFSFAAYNYFFVVFSCLWASLIPNKFLPAAVAEWIPVSLDTAPLEADLTKALVNNCGVVIVWAVAHSLFARTSVKKAMGLPESVERPFYIAQASGLLHLTLASWKNFRVGSGEPIWDVSDNEMLSKAILAFFAFGFAFQMSATMALDHFHLAGLSQGFGIDFNKKLGLAPAEEGGIVVRAHYTLVAHPIMTGMLIGVWVTPVMTFGRLLLATLYTTYIVSAVKLLEEPQLIEEMGEDYSEYLKSVPSFCPLWPMNGSSTVHVRTAETAKTK